MRIYDPVHGFIHFNALEERVIDSEPFKRLRWIHQLGLSYMIYPGATHTRFEHSLGTMHLAGQIFDQIARGDDLVYWRQMVRLAALCHDLGHLPFSHVAESWLLGELGHESWTLRLIESDLLAPIWNEVGKQFPDRSIVEHIGKLAIGKEKLTSLRPKIHFTSIEEVYSQIVTGDFFGADRIDYLLRDAKATGLSYGLFDYLQLIEMLVIISGGKGILTIGIEENGMESCEALLLARHFMQRRVYQHSSTKAYSFHLARFMYTLYAGLIDISDTEQYLSMSEHRILCALEEARGDERHSAHLDAICLTNHSKRFQAISIPKTVSRQDLEAFKKEWAIPDQAIDWELRPYRKERRSISLPILCKNGEIAPAESLSEIAIPPIKKNWLFLSPDYQFEIKKDLSGVQLPG